MKKKIIIRSTIVFAVIAVILSLVFLLPLTKTDEMKYNDAKSALSSGDYGKAYNLFRQIKGYKDTNDYLSGFEITFEKYSATLDEKQLSITRVFDDKNRVTEQIEEKFGELTKINWYYNDNDILIKETKVSGSDDSYEEVVKAYNEKGALSESVSYDKDGEEKHRETNTYDSDGNLIKTVSENYKKIYHTIEYIYENGNKVKQIATAYDDESYEGVSEFFYDENNKLIKEISTEPNGTTTVTEYQNGLIIKQQRTNKDGEIISGSEYQYDDKGNILQQDLLIVDQQSSYKYTYDKDGNQLTETYKKGNSTTVREKTYYENSNIMKSAIQKYYSYEGAEPEIQNEFYYTNRGDKLKTIIYSDGVIYTTDYTYDNAGDTVKIIDCWEREGDETMTITTTQTHDDYGNILTMTEAYNNGDVNEYIYEYSGIKIIYHPDTKE